MDQASELKLSRREEISSNIFLFFNYGKKSGFYYGILLDFEVTKELRDRYQRASKKEKTMTLNKFIRLIGYNRCYACQILKKKERVLGYLNIAGKRIKYIADKRKIKRKKKKIYDQDVLVALKKIWIICDYICSKRLAPFYPRSSRH